MLPVTALYFTCVEEEKPADALLKVDFMYLLIELISYVRTMFTTMVLM